MLCSLVRKYLRKILVPIPSLDLAGYTITFANGEGVVTDPHGNVIARAPLKNSNFNEFDIRQLFEQVETVLLGSISYNTILSNSSVESPRKSTGILPLK